MLRKLTFTFLGIFSFLAVNAQFNPDSLQTDTVIIGDTISTAVDSAFIKRQEFIRDSILAREKFVKDSILAREKFVRDSLYKRKLIRDSVSFLKKELPRLLEAILKSEKEDIIMSVQDVKIIGDSMLGDFTYRILAQNLSLPYAPWRPTIDLSGKNITVKVDTINKVVSYFKMAKKRYKFTYKPNDKIVRVQGNSSIITKKSKNYYKVPIDSIFFDANNRVKSIKSYIHYFEADKNYKKGASLYIDIIRIKKFEYFPDGVLSNNQVITYCDRWGGITPNKQCHKVTYAISREDRKFIIKESNEPHNQFSDGTFTYEFDTNFDLVKMKFKGNDKARDRICFVELNEDRNVSRYLYKKGSDFINRTLVIEYNNDPKANYKYETITCHFEKDRVCYFQRNNRTGKSRKRDRLTLKWTPWR